MHSPYLTCDAEVNPIKLLKIKYIPFSLFRVAHKTYVVANGSRDGCEDYKDKHVQSWVLQQFPNTTHARHVIISLFRQEWIALQKKKKKND